MSNKTKIDTVRNELKKYALQIENLASDIQGKLSSGDDVLKVANELARNSSTFVFVLGELSALEGDVSTKKTVKTVKSNTRPYYNLRDALGRFTSKVSPPAANLSLTNLCHFD